MLDKKIIQELNHIYNLIYLLKTNTHTPKHIKKEISEIFSNLISELTFKETESILNQSFNDSTPLMRLLEINLKDIDFNSKSKNYKSEYIAAYGLILEMLLDNGADIDAKPAYESSWWVENIHWMFNWMFSKDYINTPITTTLIDHILEINFKKYSVLYQDIVTGLETFNKNSNMIHYGLQILIKYVLAAPFDELKARRINGNHLKLMFRAIILECIHNFRDYQFKHDYNYFLKKFIPDPSLNQPILEELYSYFPQKDNLEEEFDVYKNSYFLSLIELNNLPTYTHHKRDLREHLIKNFKSFNESFDELRLLIHLDIHQNIDSHQRNNKNPEQLAKIKTILDNLKHHNATMYLEDILIRIYPFVRYDTKNNASYEHENTWSTYLLLFLEKALEFKNMSLMAKYISELSNIKYIAGLSKNHLNINNLKEFFRDLLDEIFEIPNYELSELLKSLQSLTKKFNDSTPEELKNEVYYAIIYISWKTEEIPDSNTQMYCLKNLDFLNGLSKNILYKFIRQISPFLGNIGKEITDNFFYNLLQKNASLFFKLLRDKETDNKTQCQYILENFGNVYTKILSTNNPYFNKDSLLKALEKYLSLTKQKISFMNIVPYFTTFKDIQEIVDKKLVYIPDPFEPIIRNNARVNPIIIAASTENVDHFLSMYEHRTEEPWRIYWKHAGDPESKVIQFLLKMPITNSLGYSLSKEQCRETLLTALNNKSIIENLQGEHLKNTIPIDTPQDRVVHMNWSENVEVINQKINIKIIGKNSVKKLLQRFLNLGKILALLEDSALKLKAPRHTDNAHNTMVYKDAKSIFDKDFIGLLNERYSNINPELQIKNATIDARILIIKNLIEYNVTNANDIEIRDKIVELCGLEKYMEYYNEKGKNIQDLETFADFKRTYYTGDNNKFIEMINPSNNNDSELSQYLQNLTQSTMYGKHCNLSWEPFAIKPKKYEKILSFQYAIVDNKSSRNFALFNILLATEDIKAKINQITPHDYKGLYLFVNSEEIKDPIHITARNIIQSKILKEKISPEADLNWDQLKFIITRKMLEELNSLAVTAVSTIFQCMLDKSCPEGVFVRFSDAILSNYYKYANNEFNIRIKTIQDTMFNKFEKELEKN